jgi:hypothetical protein
VIYGWIPRHPSYHLIVKEAIEALSAKERDGRLTKLNLWRLNYFEDKLSSILARS